MWCSGSTLSLGLRGRRFDPSYPDMSKSDRERNHAIKLALAERDGGLRCFYGGRALRMTGEGGIQATIDHVVPLSAGGTWELDNLRLACSPCNHLKGDGSADDLFRHLATNHAGKCPRPEPKAPPGMMDVWVMERAREATA